MTQPTPTEKWEEEFDDEFVATGVDVEGMKRVEYRQIREHRIVDIKYFIRKVRIEAHAEGYKEGDEHGQEIGYQAGHRAVEEYKHDLQENIGLLRQWLNENRITEVSKMVTSEDLKYWLTPNKPHDQTL